MRRYNEILIRDAIRFATEKALGEACTLGGYVVDEKHVDAVYKAWLSEGNSQAIKEYRE